MAKDKQNGLRRLAEKKLAEQKPKGMALTVLLPVFYFLYGLVTLALFLAKAFTTKLAFRTLSDKDKRELAAARNRIWNLNEHPFGLTHSFYELQDGKKLHYVFSRPEKVVKGKTGLVIFVHGFADSWYLWHSFLKCRRLSDDAVLIAVDLPGYGGSDSFPVHDAQTVLEALAVFILEMRKTYLPVDESDSQTRGPVVVVGHDWGAMVGFRLAAEAAGLADRFILSNSIHPPLVAANARERWASVTQMFHTWTTNPTNLGPLRAGIRNAKPLWSQLGMSAYVFVFRLPYLLAILPGIPGDFWMFRYLNAVSENINPSRPIPGAAGFDLLASSIGPSLSQIAQTANQGDVVLEYPTSVKSRASNGGWYEKIRLYREGLAFLPWEKSLETLWELNSLQQTSSGSRHRSGSLAGIFETEPPGSLRNPTTVIWGKDDHALSHTLCLQGIGDYFAVHGSNVVMLSNCGHWVPLSKHGVDAWQEVVHWAVTGEKEGLKQRLDDYPLARVVLEA